MPWTTKKIAKRRAESDSLKGFQNVIFPRDIAFTNELDLERKSKADGYHSMVMMKHKSTNEIAS
jgi:hypothetical protein